MVSPFDATPQTPAPIGLTHAEMERERQWHAQSETNWRERALAAESRVRELEAELVSIRAEVAAELARWRRP